MGQSKFEKLGNSESIINLFECNDVEVAVNLNNSKEWYFKKNDKEIIINSDEFNDSKLLWLPILNCDYKVFQKNLKNGLKERDIQPDLEFLFPYRPLLYTALNSNSEYWISLALKWIEEGVEYKGCEGLLFNISRNKRITQSIRHKALKLYAAKKR